MSRFYWVSMSLEALCAMKNGSAIKARLGKLLRKLAILYLDMYNGFLVPTYDIGQALITNTFKWLLCMHESHKPSEFIAAIAQNLSLAPTILGKDELLDLCCNLVVLDLTLDIFGFAHHSVREFLEELPAYSAPSFNTLATKRRLVYLASRSQTLSVRRFLSDH